VIAVPGESDRPPTTGDYLSFFPVSTYRERLDSLMDTVWQRLEQAPDALEKMAATARDIAERLDELALDARQRVEQTEGRSGDRDGGDRGNSGR
jgi:hypothetical protein